MLQHREFAKERRAVVAQPVEQQALDLQKCGTIRSEIAGVHEQVDRLLTALALAALHGCLEQAAQEGRMQRMFARQPLRGGRGDAAPVKAVELGFIRGACGAQQGAYSQDCGRVVWRVLLPFLGEGAQCRQIEMHFEDAVAQRHRHAVNEQ